MKRLALLLLVLALSACTPTGDSTITGGFSPTRPVALTNLTVVDGRYRVAYAMAIFVSASGAPVSVTCDVVDVSGRLAALPGMARAVASNRWVRIKESMVLELPDATLGIRCVPDRSATLTVVVRDVQLTAESVP